MTFATTTTKVRRQWIARSAFMGLTLSGLAAPLGRLGARRRCGCDAGMA